MYKNNQNRSQVLLLQDLKHVSHVKYLSDNKGNNKITELRTIFQRESQNS